MPDNSAPHSDAEGEPSTVGTGTDGSQVEPVRTEDPLATAATVNAQSSDEPDKSIGTFRRAPKHDDGKKRPAGGSWGWLRELVIIVAVALVLSFLIKTFLFRAFYIPSGSMENTLEINDRIFVNLLVPEPMSIDRGDVVVFQDTKGWLPAAPEEEAGLGSWMNEALTFVGLLPDDSQQHLVKRVIGIAGDHVVCCDADGRITVNGEPIDEPYLYPGVVPSETPFDVVVPEGQLWVMGDHRNASSDSREHHRVSGDGFVSVEDIDGEAMVIAWPLNRITLLGGYGEVFEDVPDDPSAVDPAPDGPVVVP